MVAVQQTWANRNIIRRYAAVIESASIGMGFQAIVYVTLMRHESGALQNFISAIERREEVLECVATTGDADYHLRVICADQHAYNAFLEDFLFQIPGIANVRTNLILREIKSQGCLPV